MGSQTVQPTAIITTGSGNAWSSPSNALATDDTYAVVSTGVSSSQSLRFTFENASIPTGSFINDIVISIEKKGSIAGAIIDAEVKLTRSGVPEGGNNGELIDPWPTSDTYIDHAGSPELWNVPVTPDDFNTGQIGFQISIAAGDPAQARIDHAYMTIFWDEPAESGSDAVDCHWGRNAGVRGFAGVVFRLIKFTEDMDLLDICTGDLEYYELSFDSVGQGEKFSLGMISSITGDGGSSVVWDRDNAGGAGVSIRIARVGRECESSAGSSTNSDPVCLGGPYADDCIAIQDCANHVEPVYPCKLYFDSIGQLERASICGRGAWDRDDQNQAYAGCTFDVIGPLDESSQSAISTCEHCDDEGPIMPRRLVFDSCGQLVTSLCHFGTGFFCSVQNGCCAENHLPVRIQAIVEYPTFGDTVGIEVCCTWDGECSWRGRFTMECRDGSFEHEIALVCESRLFAATCVCRFVLYADGARKELATATSCCPIFAQFAEEVSLPGCPFCCGFIHNGAQVTFMELCGPGGHRDAKCVPEGEINGCVEKEDPPNCLGEST